jgi:transcription elongation factor GreA
MEYVTKEKAKELEIELHDLKTTKRKEIAEALEYAKSLGDLSENAEYSQAREAQAQVEERVARIEHILRTAKIVTVSHSTTVGVGSTVHVVKSGTRTEQVFTIVGAEEADTAAGKISPNSPLGAALLGKVAGEVAILTTPKGEIKYTVKSID